MVQSDHFSCAFSFDSAFTYGNLSTASISSDGRNRASSSFTYAHHPVYCREDAEHISEESFPSKFLRKIIIGVSYVAVIILFPLSVWFCLKKVQSLERLVVFRLGKLQPIVGPGFILLLPFIDQWNKVDLKSKTLCFPTQQLITADGAIIEVVVKVKYCVSHVVHYVTRLYNQESSMKDLILYCLGNLISEKEQFDVEKRKEMIASAVKIELNKTVINWGLEVIEVSIENVKVLKEAVMSNPLDSILMILKSINVGNGCESKNKVMLTDHAHLGAEQGLEGVNVMDPLFLKIKSIAENAASSVFLTNECATYKFILIDDDARIIFLSYNKGALTVLEGENASLVPDVIITLSSVVMNDLLNAKFSPLQAYIQGKIQITGDFELLKIFGETFGAR